ncbi:hypothetical protein [Bdellovibrio sp. NC01]|uniref:hypothetical protein n=1 Tax=Bdellovibrio sp. NC01 TaxID=2220073 RepID=UPI001158E605|nr:hypothetical protein [Bdellovibrio sp. NC01]
MAYGQGLWALSSDQVLKTAWSDKTYLVQDDLQQTNSKNPLRTVEAFVAGERNGKEEIEYGLKFQFKSWPEWKNVRSKDSEQKLLKESSLAWALRDRYAVLTTYDLSQSKLKLLDQAVTVADRNVKAQSLALKAGRATSKSYLKAQVDQLKLKKAVNTAQEELAFCKRKIQQWLPEWKGEEPSDLKSWSVEDIDSYLQKAPAEDVSLSKKIAAEELQELSDELTILKGRESQWVKAFEIGQTQKKGDERSLEVELTFQLPGLGHDELNRQKQNQIVLKKALKQRDIENINDPVKTLRLQILNQIDLYKLTQASVSKVSRPGSDPLVNIEVKMEEMQERLDLLTQQQQITNLFLDYLLESEMLNRQPEKNHLSSLLKEAL